MELEIALKKQIGTDTGNKLQRNLNLENTYLDWGLTARTGGGVDPAGRPVATAF